MIYILEFSDVLGNRQNKRGQARYYVGWCEDGTLDRRIAAHRRGTGAAITRAAVNRGMTLSLVATLPGDRTEERRIKSWKNTPRLVKRLQSQEATLCTPA